jgi:hypothetical protein
MSTPPTAPVDPATARLAFDSARDAFLVAFEQAPDASLAYVPAGDEYAIGTLLPHLVGSMRGYLDVFARIQRTGFGPVDLSTDSERATSEQRHHAELVALRPTGAERQRLLGELRATHQQVCDKLSALDVPTFTRQAPVVYSLGATPYPTSYRDIMGWLIDHYHEHVTQLGDLLMRWRGQE